MALIRCSECGKEISDQAEVCPNCGAKTKAGQQLEAVSTAKQNYKDTEKNLSTFVTVDIIICLIALFLMLNDNFEFGLILFIISCIGAPIIQIILSSQVKKAKEELDTKTGQVTEVNKEFTWKCPNCGKDNPIAYSYCTYCTYKKPNPRSFTK